MFRSAKTFRFRGRFPSFNDFSRMTRPVPLEKARWGDGFVCPHCQTAAEPFRFTSRPGVLRCRKCRRHRADGGDGHGASHTSLGMVLGGLSGCQPDARMSATQFQRQVGLSRYETAFQILHKLRAGMVRPDQDRIGSEACDHVEVDETWVGGRTRGGPGRSPQASCAVEVRQRKPGTKLDKRKGGRSDVSTRCRARPQRGIALRLCRGRRYFGCVGHRRLVRLYQPRQARLQTPRRRRARQVAEEYLPIIHLVFANLKTWLAFITAEPPAPPSLPQRVFRFSARSTPSGPCSESLAMSPLPLTRALLGRLGAP